MWVLIVALLLQSFSLLTAAEEENERLRMSNNEHKYKKNLIKEPEGNVREGRKQRS